MTDFGGFEGFGGGGSASWNFALSAPTADTAAEGAWTLRAAAVRDRT